MTDQDMIRTRATTWAELTGQPPPWPAICYQCFTHVGVFHDRDKLSSAVEAHDTVCAGKPVLYPTPTRLALLRELAIPLQVWTDHLTGESYIAENGPKVTARIKELRVAGWVVARDMFWELTDTGRAVLEARVDAQS